MDTMIPLVKKKILACVCIYKYKTFINMRYKHTHMIVYDRMFMKESTGSSIEASGCRTGGLAVVVSGKSFLNIYPFLIL